MTRLNAYLHDRVHEGLVETCSVSWPQDHMQVDTRLDGQSAGPGQRAEEAERRRLLLALVRRAK